VDILPRAALGTPTVVLVRATPIGAGRPGSPSPGAPDLYTRARTHKVARPRLVSAARRPPYLRRMVAGP